MSTQPANRYNIAARVVDVQRVTVDSDGFIDYGPNDRHSVHSDVRVIGSKIDARTDVMAGVRRDFDAAEKLLSDLFSRYEKALTDMAGVGIEAQFSMSRKLSAAFAAWQVERGKSVEGLGEAPVPPLHEDNR